MVNANGGVDGRKIEFMTLDDAYEPPKAIQNARRLVQQEEVFALFNTLGTANNVAIWDYANKQEVPHLYVATGASLWGADIEAHPWTTGWQPDYVTESQVYADYLEKEKPDAKVAVLYQNDAFGEDLLNGFKEAIEGTDSRSSPRRATRSPTRPSARRCPSWRAPTRTPSSTSPPPSSAAQAIVAADKLGWKVLHIINNVSASKLLGPSRPGWTRPRGSSRRPTSRIPQDPSGRTTRRSRVQGGAGQVLTQR